MTRRILRAGRALLFTASAFLCGLPARAERLAAESNTEAIRNSMLKWEAEAAIKAYKRSVEGGGTTRTWMLNQPPVCVPSGWILMEAKKKAEASGNLEDALNLLTGIERDQRRLRETSVAQADRCLLWVREGSLSDDGLRDLLREYKDRIPAERARMEENAFRNQEPALEWFESKLRLARLLPEKERYLRNWIDAARDVPTVLAVSEASVEPTEVEPGCTVHFRAVYFARRIRDRGVKINEKMTVVGAGAPAATKSASRSFSDYQHGDAPGLEDGFCRVEIPITATTPGEYTCRVEISCPGAENAVASRTFRVKKPAPGTTGTQTGNLPPTKAKGVWRRGAAQVDPRTTSEEPITWEGKVYGFKRQKMTATAYSRVEQKTGMDGKTELDWTWDIQYGSPPSELRPGQVVELSASGTSGGSVWGPRVFGLNGGDWKTSGGGKWELVHTSVTAPDGTRGFFVGRWGPGVDIRQADARWRITVSDDPPDKFSVFFSMPNVGSVVYAYEKAGESTGTSGDGVAPGGDTPKPEPPEIGGDGGGGGEGGEGGGGGGGGDGGGGALSVRVQTDPISLRPGDISKISGIFVRGWKGNTADRVEIVIPTVDLFGALQVNQDIVASPGATSADAGNMDGVEYYFSEMWRARSGSTAGTFTVPIVARQGNAAAQTTLTVIILPANQRNDPLGAGSGGAGGGAAGGGGAPPVAGAGLRARLAYASLDLVPGEVSSICGVYVRDWRGNTADRVEIVIPTLDLFGALQMNPDIIVSPGRTSSDPGNMDREEFYFPEMWRAREGAAPGAFNVPIIVQQQGAGAVQLNLVVNILSPGRRGGRATGTSPGQAGGGAVTGRGQTGGAGGGGRIVRPGGPQMPEVDGTGRGEPRPDTDHPGTDRNRGDRPHDERGGAMGDGHSEGRPASPGGRAGSARDLHGETAGDGRGRLIAPLFGFTTVFGIVDGQATVVGLGGDSPLGRAGVKPEDRIVEINGQEIAKLDTTAIVEVLRTKPGAKYAMVIARGSGDVFRIEVTAP